MSDASREALRSARRIVVKVGTAVVAGAGGLALGRLGGLVEQLHLLRQGGREVMLVTSGAIGVGARKLGMPTPVTGVVDRQACAAAGQGALMALYDNLFRQVGCVSAQVLLTEGDFLHRTRYLALHDTLDRLLQLGAIPVINENDTVSTAELALGRD
jgi:glutamate 5-kinase